ncbi:phytanoyl-CoA dioxygenase family protein [Aquirufa rosea]|nr:phytanoyl-CoA dioxygenase family protein [Aquirufa rosea]
MQESTQPTMTMGTMNAHWDIPGNPSLAKSSITQLNDGKSNKTLKALSQEEFEFWLREGYIVVKNAISKEQAALTAQAIWEFEEKDPLDKSTWYTEPRAEMQMRELVGSGMVEMYNHPLLWTNRQSQRVYDAFVDIWGTEDLWVTIDRCNLNFPVQPNNPFKGFIHWDYDPETKPVNVQGVLALVDQTDENMGGFQCIPELYRTYDTWKLTQPADRDRFKPDITGLELKKVKMEAGDLLIFNSLLAHGIRPNLTQDKVRIAQYISMMPAEPQNKALLEWRINSWKNKIAPEGYAFPGDPRGKEKSQAVAELSVLGKKLLGIQV